MLPLGGLHVKHAVQRGIWVPAQHLLEVTSQLTVSQSACLGIEHPCGALQLTLANPL
jgi:hypothetical protein